MLAGNKFGTKEEVIVETEAYSEAISKWYYKNGIEKLLRENVFKWCTFNNWQLNSR
jgi:hypothetical protein